MPPNPDRLARRHFLGQVAAATLLPVGGLLRGQSAALPAAGEFQAQAESLLRDWCDGLLRQQIREPQKPESHGAFRCPACARIHGRGGEAVLPLLAMARRSGEKRYLDAALAAWQWMKNVDAPDGAWTNETDPKSWKGITVFSAIALAESLEWYGDLLDETTRGAIRHRLRAAGGFIHAEFTTEYGNINYPAAGAYGLCLLGHLLDEPRFREKGRQLAHQLLAFFTPRDHFLFGEGHPSERRSAKGCYPVDLGYNVAESLPSLVHYAYLENDREMLAALMPSLRTHLEFMLPDGAWDNSWGTRSYKWSYWGSRTADGCQAAFVRLAAADPVFATAGLRNLQLLRACTRDGLLHGGPHFADHGVPPCVHHTFSHAKVIAAALHHLPVAMNSPVTPALPRALAAGVRHFPEIDVYLAAAGPWRATVSGYDWFYKPGLYQASGGTVGLLWHQRLGPLLAAGLADYLPIEAANMQALPEGGDFPLGCRVEMRPTGGGWFTNLHDGTATIRHEADGEIHRFIVETRLLSAQGADPQAGPAKFRITYTLKPDAFTLLATPLETVSGDWSLVVPVVSRSSDKLGQAASSRWEITKPGGVLEISSNRPIDRLPAPVDRAFNLIPGFQAVPFRVASRAAEPAEFILSSPA